MVATVHGFYRDGVIELDEKPNGVCEGPVLVTVKDDAAAPAPRPLQYGKYVSDHASTEEDFTLAEWREEEFAG